MDGILFQTKEAGDCNAFKVEIPSEPYLTGSTVLTLQCCVYGTDPFNVGVGKSPGSPDW